MPTARPSRLVRLARRTHRGLVYPLLSFVLPSICFACRAPLGPLQRLGACAECWARLRILRPPLCGGCGLPPAAGTDLLGQIHERRENHEGAVLQYRKVIKDMDLVQLDYVCRACGETAMEWIHRCPACGSWNTVEVNFRQEIPLEDLGLARAPIYSAQD